MRRSTYDYPLFLDRIYQASRLLCFGLYFYFLSDRLL